MISTVPGWEGNRLFLPDMAVCERPIFFVEIFPSTGNFTPHLVARQFVVGSPFEPINGKSTQ